MVAPWRWRVGKSIDEDGTLNAEFAAGIDQTIAGLSFRLDALRQFVTFVKETGDRRTDAASGPRSLHRPDGEPLAGARMDETDIFQT
jgi:hypothetical protein